MDSARRPLPPDNPVAADLQRIRPHPAMPRTTIPDNPGPQACPARHPATQDTALDTVHLSPEGHEAMANAIWNVVGPRTQTRPDSCVEFAWLRDPPSMIVGCM